jgi:hypothetical protein
LSEPGLVEASGEVGIWVSEEDVAQGQVEVGV